MIVLKEARAIFSTNATAAAAEIEFTHCTFVLIINKSIPYKDIKKLVVLLRNI